MPSPAGYQTEGTQFPVILSDLLKPEDRAKLLATLVGFKTAAQAHAAARELGFGVETMDHRGRVVLLKWKGADVALLYQRSITMVTVLPQESLGAFIKSPEEAWVMLNLVNMHYDQELHALRVRVQQAEQAYKSSSGLLIAVQSEATQKGLALDDHVTRVALLEQELKQYKEAVRVLEKGGKPVIYKVRPKEVYKVEKKRGPTNWNAQPAGTPVKLKKGSNKFRILPPKAKDIVHTHKFKKSGTKKQPAKKAPVKAKAPPKKKKK